MPKTIDKDAVETTKRYGNPVKSRMIHDRWDFDSFEELLDVMAEPLTDEQKAAWLCAGDNVVESQKRGQSQQNWTGTRTFKQALDLARTGWTEGRERFDANLSELTPYVEAAMRENSVTLAPAGYLPNVPAMCAGSPQYMYAETDEGEINARTRVIRLLLCISTSFNVGKETLERRGAAVAAAVDYFESIGVRVEVEICHVAEDSGADGYFPNGDRKTVKVMHEHYIMIKRADEAIEPDRFAFMLGHASVLRRFIFKLDEMNAKAGPIMRSGYGRPCDANPDPDQVYFPKLTSDSGYRDNAQALRTVLGHVKESLSEEAKAKVDADWADILGTERAAI